MGPGMKKNIVLLGTLALSASLAFSAYAKEPKKAPEFKLDEMKFDPVNPKDENGLKISVLWGNPKKGNFGALLKLPANMTSPLHTHTSLYRAVVIQGTVMNWPEGKEAEAKPLTPGGYWEQPGKEKHVTKCASDQECLVFITMPGPMDAKIVQEKGVAKKDAAPAEKKMPAAEEKKPEGEQKQ